MTERASGRIRRGNDVTYMKVRPAGNKQDGEAMKLELRRRILGTDEGVPIVAEMITVETDCFVVSNDVKGIATYVELSQRRHLAQSGPFRRLKRCIATKIEELRCETSHLQFFRFRVFSDSCIFRRPASSRMRITFGRFASTTLFKGENGVEMLNSLIQWSEC